MLTLWKKSYDKPRQHIKKQYIIFTTQVCKVKDMVFPEVMYGCESWNIKKTEHQRIDTFKLWCWRRLLRFPWTAMKSIWSFLKENQPWLLNGRTVTEDEVPILRLPDAKSWLIEKDTNAGKYWGKRRRGWQRMRWLVCVTNSMDMNLSKLWKKVKNRGACCVASMWFRVSHDLVTDQ